MRNPLARLVHRNPAKPTLRERLNTLKATASHAIRRKPVDAAPVASATADPILAAISETQRLAWARTRAFNLPLPTGTIDPTPEQNATTDAFFVHVDGVLLKTVPTTAEGCTALARFAVEFRADQGFNIDEDHANAQHVRILDLIARSPMLGSVPTGKPLAPDFSGMSLNALIRTYDAFKLATDVAGLTTWTLGAQEDAGGSLLLDAEADRLSHFQDYIAAELARRGLSEERGTAGRQSIVLIDRAISCGEFEEAALFASEANSRRL
ncbi:hypothetical protein FPV16_18025 [Methylobacterium sp. W2]|uniref:hypothetical protein n=1 Tax=Methylobacterium sp. W2 TaxID=2598107 RepID=UPI001D0CA383|nr:hypothetical protein [Methylobacterium sp. W2]MCC0808086.1 hypothetical protein [Methylobacterium sp. W2]